jgi:hypothetical protein
MTEDRSSSFTSFAVTPLKSPRGQEKPKRHAAHHQCPSSEESPRPTFVDADGKQSKTSGRQETQETQDEEDHGAK